ncbi:MAG: glycogen-binding domain-containing protein [Chitinophagaceae bacterium]
MNPHTSPHVNPQKKTIEFFFHTEYASHVTLAGASQVSLSGSFNNWAQDELLMKPDKDGLWVIEIPILPKGRYYYKFFVDDKLWIEDIDNPYREPDGLTGFKSILFV